MTISPGIDLGLRYTGQRVIKTTAAAGKLAYAACGLLRTAAKAPGFSGGSVHIFRALIASIHCASGAAQASLRRFDPQR